jgi:hypothetical protein
MPQWKQVVSQMSESLDLFYLLFIPENRYGGEQLQCGGNEIDRFQPQLSGDAQLRKQHNAVAKRLARISYPL